MSAPFPVGARTTGKGPGLGLALLAALACGSEALPTDAREATPTDYGPIPVVPLSGLDAFEAQLDSIRVGSHIPGMAAAIVQDGEIVWSRGFGSARQEDSLPATPSTPFHLASLTKPFASVVVMQLVERGMISLDDPVSNFGIHLESPGTVRVRHLLTHTSEGVPGESYRYNGGRFALLDQVIARTTGRSFSKILCQEILGPLALENTAPNPLSPSDFAHSGLDRDAFVARMAAGYSFDGVRVSPARHPSYFGTAAGLVASVEDMAAFSTAIDEGRFLEPETWERVMTPATSLDGTVLPYGLGWFIHYYEGMKLEWHYGHWTTNSSLILRVPWKKLTFIAVANTEMLSRPYGLGLDSNVMRSVLARLFVESFAVGDDPIPGS